MADRSDMSIFWLTAWTDDVSGIPVEKDLRIPEPEPLVKHASAKMEKIFANLPEYL